MDKFMEHTKEADNHRAEQQRLEGQHEVIMYAMGRPIYAPFDVSTPGMRILDSGCANGRWLRDLRASVSAKHEYVGTDIEPSIFPADSPDMTFQVQSIKDDWPTHMQSTFDLVHQRLVMAGAAPDSPKQVIARLATLLKPGGWLQLIEIDNEFQDSFMFDAIGVGADSTADFGRWMGEAGLKNVQEKIVDYPVGETIGDKSLKQKSIEGPCGALGPFLSVVKSFPHPYEEENLDNLEPRLRKELDEKGGYFKLRVVWGQK